jgi:hypothetical protein
MATHVPLNSQQLRSVLYEAFAEADRHRDAHDALFDSDAFDAGLSAECHYAVEHVRIERGEPLRLDAEQVDAVCQLALRDAKVAAREAIIARLEVSLAGRMVPPVSLRAAIQAAFASSSTSAPLHDA